MSTSRLITPMAAVSTAAALFLVGCGATEDEPIDPIDTAEAPPADQDTEDPAETGTPGEDGATEEPTPDDTGGTGTADTGSGAGDHAGVLAGIDLAEAETGGTAFEVDDADGGNWEISIADGEDELEVLVSSDGSQVLATDREGNLDAEDRAGLEAATITLVEAIEIAAEHGTGMLDEVNLDDEGGGTYAWEVTFTDDVEVYLDVDGGEILRIEQD